MIHYHGTPITPRPVLQSLSGKNFCISYAAPNDLKTCLASGQSVMGDSGEFSRHTRGLPSDIPGYITWLRPWLRHPHWAVAPDIIGGTVEQQREALKQWPYPRHCGLGAAVWHIHLPLDYLAELVDTWPRVCFGSSGEFWELGTDKWRERITEAWNYLKRRNQIEPNVHMLRAMNEASNGPWPFASADSTMIARNHAGAPSVGRHKKCAVKMAHEIDSRNPPAEYVIRPEQMGLAA
jgi:hypothetical protein